METGVADYPIPEPIYIRPSQEPDEIKSYYGWEDMSREEAERVRDDERAPLPYYLGTRVDLLA